MSFWDAARELFGGKDDSAQEEQLTQNELARSAAATQADIARRDISEAYRPMSRAAAAGSQGALSVLGGALPQQLANINQGSEYAQRMILGGLPLLQDAILGRNMDLRSITRNVPRFQLSTDTSYIPTQLPQEIANPDYTPNNSPVNPFISPDYLAYAQRAKALGGNY